MPFFLVYDPPNSTGPYLIGDRKGSREKQFPTFSAAEYRLRQIGRTARSHTMARQFTNLADANSYCITIRQARRTDVVVTQKSPPRRAVVPSEEAQPRVGRPVSPEDGAGAGDGLGDGA